MMEYPPVAQARVKYNNRVLNNNFYSIDQVPPKEAGSLVQFYHIWRNSNNEQAIPSRKDITFEKLRGWHANIRLVDLVNSAPDFDKILISGSVFDDYFGKETMRTEIINSSDTDAETLKRYDEFLEYFYTRHYNLGIGSSPNPDGRITQLIWIDLPLANDGINITHMLTALTPLK